jgi:hypothetical protein
VSLEGNSFFYTNPLESDGDHQRREYFTTACCPSNLARLMGQLPGFVYATQGDRLYVNLFIGSEARVELPGGALRLVQETDYPWDGTVRLTVAPVASVGGTGATPERATGGAGAGAGRAGRGTVASQAGSGGSEQRAAAAEPMTLPADFEIYLRIPGWARNQPVPSDLYTFAEPSDATPALRVNGEPIALERGGGFAVLDRTWNAGDTVELVLPMPVRRVAAHPSVENNAGHLAIQRGPLVYAVEAVDNGGSALDIALPADAELTPEHRPEMLGGVTVLRGMGLRDGEPFDLLAVPYFAWANREPGEMAVWLPAAR